MIIKLVSILALLASLSDGAANNLAHQFIQMNEGQEGMAEIVSNRNLECNIDTFSTDAALCLSGTGATKDLSNYLSDSNTTITESQFRVLLHYYSGLHTTEYQAASADTDGLKKLADLISSKNIEKFAEYPDLLKYLILRINVETLVKLNNFEAILDSLNRTDYIQMINLLAKKSAGIAFLKENAENIIKSLAKERPIAAPEELPESESDELGIVHVHAISDTAFGALISDPERCSSLTADQIRQALHTPEHAKLLTEKCMSNVAATELEALDCPIGIREVKPEVFRKVTKLGPKCYKLMTADQVAEFDADNEHNKCSGYPLKEDVIFANGAKMKKDCFAGALEAWNASETEIKNAWYNLPEDILSGITREEDLSKLSKEWQYMPATHKQALFNNIELCSNIPDGALEFHGDVKISNECFSKLSERNKVDSIIHARLDDDVLAELSASDDFKNWEREEHKGLAILNLALSKRNIRAIVKNMSSKHPDNHACKEISTIDELEAATAVQLYADDACFKSLGTMLETVSLSDVKKLEPRAQKLVNMDSIVKNLSESAYSDLDAPTFTTLISSSSICSSMTFEQFERLKEECIKMIDEKCLNAVTFHEKMTKAKLGLVPASAFASLEADVMAKISRDAMSIEQFGNASSSVTDPGKHHASKWAPAVVTGIAASDMHHIHRSAWDAAPAEAYAGFTKEGFAAVPPANMHGMTFAKLKEVPIEALAGLTLEQAREVGKDAKVEDPEKDHPAMAFDKVELPEAQRTILNERKSSHPKPEKD